MRRSRLGELLCRTNTAHEPTFQLRRELFRLARGQLSVKSLDGTNQGYVELELEPVALVCAVDALIVLGAGDVQGGDLPALERGKRIVT